MPIPAIWGDEKPAAMRGSVKQMPEGELKDAAKHIEHMKAAVCSNVEHPFRVVKRQFGYQVVRQEHSPDTDTLRPLEPVNGATNVADIYKKGAPVR